MYITVSYLNEHRSGSSGIIIVKFTFSCDRQMTNVAAEQEVVLLLDRCVITQGTFDFV